MDIPFIVCTRWQNMAKNMQNLHIPTKICQKIRKFQNKDAREVCEIIRRCDKEISSKDYSKKIIDWWISKTTPERILKNSKNRFCIVAISEEKVVGYASLEKNEIKKLHVNPNFHKQGIGKKLISEIENFSIKNKFDKIVVESTIYAEKFYKKCGFKKIKIKNCEYDKE
jgi:N-acetylglutamate synthase-like GNAT family acetyltransferase